MNQRRQSRKRQRARPGIDGPVAAVFPVFFDLFNVLRLNFRVIRHQKRRIGRGLIRAATAEQNRRRAIGRQGVGALIILRFLGFFEFGNVEAQNFGINGARNAAAAQSRAGMTRIEHQKRIFGLELPDPISQSVVGNVAFEGAAAIHRTQFLVLAVGLVAVLVGKLGE